MYVFFFVFFCIYVCVDILSACCISRKCNFASLCKDKLDSLCKDNNTVLMCSLCHFAVSVFVSIFFYFCFLFCFHTYILKSSLHCSFQTYHALWSVFMCTPRTQQFCDLVTGICGSVFHKILVFDNRLIF